METATTATRLLGGNEMAAQKCPECGGVVSSMAEHCPHCGRPTAAKLAQDSATGIIAGVSGCGCLILRMSFVAVVALALSG